MLASNLNESQKDILNFLVEPCLEEILKSELDVINLFKSLINKDFACESCTNYTNIEYLHKIFWYPNQTLLNFNNLSKSQSTIGEIRLYILSYLKTCILKSSNDLFVDYSKTLEKLQQKVKESSDFTEILVSEKAKPTLLDDIQEESGVNIIGISEDEFNSLDRYQQEALYNAEKVRFLLDKGIDKVDIINNLALACDIIENIENVKLVLSILEIKLKDLWKSERRQRCAVIDSIRVINKLVKAYNVDKGLLIENAKYYLPIYEDVNKFIMFINYFDLDANQILSLILDPKKYDILNFLLNIENNPQSKNLPDYVTQEHNKSIPHKWVILKRFNIKITNILNIEHPDLLQNILIHHRILLQHNPDSLKVLQKIILNCKGVNEKNILKLLKSYKANAFFILDILIDQNQLKLKEKFENFNKILAILNDLGFNLNESDIVMLPKNNMPEINTGHLHTLYKLGLKKHVILKNLYEITLIVSNKDHLIALQMLSKRLDINNVITSFIQIIELYPKEDLSEIFKTLSILNIEYIKLIKDNIYTIYSLSLSNIDVFVICNKCNNFSQKLKFIINNAHSIEKYLSNGGDSEILQEMLIDTQKFSDKDILDYLDLINNSFVSQLNSSSDLSLSM
ncbi:MAG: hypothetical protein BGO27_07435 [Alphaproteobacteria bacterium 33-17]|nr:MAG: hypothetical protein BGO27_07435 [Alphaproteobacteria bacterium 33-17]